MHEYRLTKYDPQYRDASGIYTREEWTFFAQIGTMVAGEILTRERYESVEMAYIQTISKLVDLTKIGPFFITDLSRYAPRFLENGDLIQPDQLPDIVEDALREKYWCRLIDEDRHYIHFGQDFYVYIGLPQKSEELEQIALGNGLFLETCESRYHPENDD